MFKDFLHTKRFSKGKIKMIGVRAILCTYWVPATVHSIFEMAFCGSLLIQIGQLISWWRRFYTYEFCLCRGHRVPFRIVWCVHKTTFRFFLFVWVVSAVQLNLCQLQKARKSRAGCSIDSKPWRTKIFDRALWTPLSRMSIVLLFSKFGWHQRWEIREVSMNLGHLRCIWRRI
jgi:hypothetical protein